jgi:hypothetical protein
LTRRTQKIIFPKIQGSPLFSTLEAGQPQIISFSRRATTRIPSGADAPLNDEENLFRTILNEAMVELDFAPEPALDAFCYYPAFNYQESMHQCLERQGEKGEFSSDIAVLTMNKQCNSVIKFPEGPKYNPKVSSPSCGPFRSVRAELLAYLLAEELLDTSRIKEILGDHKLVPEVKITVAPKGGKMSFATMRDMVDSLLYTEEEEAYDALHDIQTNDEAIQILKIFLFVIGQHDLRNGNVRLTPMGLPVAIDNERILDPSTEVARVNNYEDLHTKKSLWHAMMLKQTSIA